MQLDWSMLSAVGRVASRLVLVLVLALVAVKVADIVVARLFRPRPGTRVWQLEESRSRTLASLVRSAVRYTVTIFAALMVLDLVGIDTKSLLGGVAIAGLAIGFGAQNLVRDVISGFFIIYERQYDVGDYIKAAGVAGVVEEVGLRVTKLRDWSGEVHVIPNGQIDITTNLSRAGSRALVEVSVAYEADLRRAISVMQEACDRAARELPAITEGPTVLGVKELGDSGVKLLVWARTQPLEQWGVERELRLRLKEALDAAGIEIPYPRVVVYDRSDRGADGDQISRG
ncbi:MAG: mechanosensitive ion channel family protein [Firmicutes bacterium]|nr:mechanosensitive ion channel family protein [Bacillota bacterium]